MIWIGEAEETTISLARLSLRSWLGILRGGKVLEVEVRKEKRMGRLSSQKRTVMSCSSSRQEWISKRYGYAFAFSLRLSRLLCRYG